MDVPLSALRCPPVTAIRGRGRRPLNERLTTSFYIAEHSGRSVSLVGLFEARLMIEPQLAARAAESASLEDLKSMRRTFPAMQTDPVSAGITFHEAVCNAMEIEFVIGCSVRSMRHSGRAWR